MALEQQIETLAQLDLPLNDGVTVDDLLYSWERKEYENQPYDLVLFVLGSEVEREPWGRNICIGHGTSTLNASKIPVTTSGSFNICVASLECHI